MKKISLTLACLCVTVIFNNLNAITNTSQDDYYDECHYPTTHGLQPDSFPVGSPPNRARGGLLKRTPETPEVLKDRTKQESQRPLTPSTEMLRTESGTSSNSDIPSEQQTTTPTPRQQEKSEQQPSK